MTQQRHPFPQLLQRQQILLVGGEQPFHALADSREVPLHCLRTLLRGIGSLGGGQPAIQFLLNQCRILKQPYHFGPDDLVQQILPHGARVAPRAPEVPPPVRSDAPVVVDSPGA